MTRPGFTVTIANWHTPPGPPRQVTADETRRNIAKLSSKFAQNGGVPGLKSLATARLSCGTASLAPCPGSPWLSNNAGDSAAARIISQSTQRATLPPPPRVTHVY